MNHAILIAIFAVFFALQIHTGDEAQVWVEPIQCHKGCTLIPGDCWLWTAGKFRTGYAQFSVNGKAKSAHRFSWELANGPIPKGTGHHGTCVLQHCDVRHCVRPSHLFLGTNSENMADMARKGRHADTHGEAHPGAKLDNICVVLIRDIYAEGRVTYKQLGSFFGVSRQQICHIVRRKQWSHI